MGKPTELTTSWTDATLNGQCRQAISMRPRDATILLLEMLVEMIGTMRFRARSSSMSTEVGLY